MTRAGAHNQTGDRAAGSVRRWSRRRRGWLVLSSLLALVLVGACSSTNSYPIDFFSEMHYQKSWHAQEPPRLDSPAAAVPVGARMAENLAYAKGASMTPEVDYTQQEATGLQNPLANDPAARARGQAVYNLNCVQCHGQQGLGADTPNPGRGNAILVAYFTARNQLQPADKQFALPANLTAANAAGRSDGELYWIITNGMTPTPGYEDRLTQMPSFKNLLTAEERWALVSYIRQLQGR